MAASYGYGYASPDTRYIEDSPEDCRRAGAYERARRWKHVDERLVNLPTGTARVIASGDTPTGDQCAVHTAQEERLDELDAITRVIIAERNVATGRKPIVGVTQAERLDELGAMVRTVIAERAAAKVKPPKTLMPRTDAVSEINDVSRLDASSDDFLNEPWFTEIGNGVMFSTRDWSSDPPATMAIRTFAFDQPAANGKIMSFGDDKF